MGIHHLRTLAAGMRAILVLTLVTGVLYTLVLTGVGQLVLPDRANGSLLVVDGHPVGSTLIGQSFTDGHEPLARYFQSRPSLAGDHGYDGAASGASNMGPENPELVRAVKERRAQVAAFNGVRPDQVPADAVTASSSGLDPHISPVYAAIQVDRVARARGISPDRVRSLVARYTRSRQLGFLGDPRVNVLELNAALDGGKG